MTALDSPSATAPGPTSTSNQPRPPSPPVTAQTSPPGRGQASAQQSQSQSSVPTPLRDAHGRILNPRSCVTCRRRKVKCDKLHPCSNCSRAHIECVFPTPGRAPRKARKVSDTRDAELLARLRRLEGVVKGLGVEVPPAAQEALPELTEGANPSSSNHAQDPDHNQNDKGEEEWKAMNQYIDEVRSNRFENRFGRLVINEGRSRYVNSSFWANLSNEVEDLKGILNQDSDEDNNDDSPIQSQAGQHQGWIFSFSSQNVDLLSLHPIPVQIESYWDIFKERVDPLVKVLHIPTIEPTVLAAASHLANLSKSFEALLFAIYYSATTSLTAEECLAKVGEEKGLLLARYRFGVEQALARANFLTTEEIMVLQSLVIFLICLRRNSDARVIWTLTGLVVRIAQTLGVHRDGAHFGLAPFDIEMRRRLWWQICILDVRASEDHGSDPTIVEQAFDTKMPLNINDADMSPTMDKFPTERQGCTDMSFSSIRFEVANTFRRLNYIPPGHPKQCGDFFASVSLEDKERWINECHKRLEERYLKHVDMSVPIYWVTATVARLMMSKMWLMIYHPFQRRDGGKSLTDETREKLFITSLENIEYSSLLETESRTEKWGWLFKTYMQWHALAFLLGELCHRTTGEIVERAWVAVEKCCEANWNGAIQKDGSRSSHLWRPLMKLLGKARSARLQALRKEEEIRQATPPGVSPEAPRSRMVRAPLSTAQLTRFMRPAAYGSQPLDSTQLMNSPKGQEAIFLGEEDPMDVSYLLPETANETLAEQTLEQVNAENGFSTTATSSSQADYQNYGNQGTFTSPPMTTNQIPISTAFSTSNPSAPINNTTPSGLSPFDPEIDWQNWDQLVRQFGLEESQYQNPAVGQPPANWNGTWSNMGNGMSGGTWF